jgi:hypothetical protein
MITFLSPAGDVLFKDFSFVNSIYKVCNSSRGRRFKLSSEYEFILTFPPRFLHLTLVSVPVLEPYSCALPVFAQDFSLYKGLVSSHIENISFVIVYWPYFAVLRSPKCCFYFYATFFAAVLPCNCIIFLTFS